MPANVDSPWMLLNCSQTLIMRPQKIGRGVARRFGNLDSDDRAAGGVEPLLQFPEDVLGNVLGRRILARGIENGVQIRVIEHLDGFGQCGFHEPEIDADSQFIQRLALHECPDDPVMTVNVFARSVIVFQMMRRGKAGFG